MWPILLAACVGGSETSPTEPTDSTIPPDALCSAEIPLDGPRVLTTGGVVEGVVGLETVAFLGIPYVEPPLGEYRLAAPEPYACRDGEVIDASAFGPQCPQWADNVVVGDEDCLHLNVWTPATDGGARPVLVFIHGGGNVQGSTSQGNVGLYDGAKLAALNDAVVVTLNYRLGALGYLAHPDLGITNFGLRDQQAALRWVQDNVAAFGGDPGRVMLFGESAGGVNTCMQLASPGAADLFHTAIIQSGGCTAAPTATAEDQGTAAVAELACDEATDLRQCLRNVPVEDFVDLHDPLAADTGSLAGGGFGPSVDGDVLPLSPLDAVEQGTHNDIPVVFGSNAHETSGWTPMLTDEQYEALVRSSWPVIADQVLEQYPVSDYDSGRWAWIAITTDLQFTCNTTLMANMFAEHGQSPVWRYLFSKSSTGLAAALRASHGNELFYVFQTLEALEEQGGYLPDAQDPIVEAAMGQAWGRFATDQVPSVPNAELWPEWDPVTQSVMEFGDPIAVGPSLRRDACAFWLAFF